MKVHSKTLSIYIYRDSIYKFCQDTYDIFQYLGYFVMKNKYYMLNAWEHFSFWEQRARNVYHGSQSQPVSLQWLLFVSAFEKCGGRAWASAQDRRKCGWSPLNCDCTQHRRVGASLRWNWAPFLWNLRVSSALCHMGHSLGPVILHVVCRPALFFWFMHLTNHNFQKVGGFWDTEVTQKPLRRSTVKMFPLTTKLMQFALILFFKALMHKKKIKVKAQPLQVSALLLRCCTICYLSEDCKQTNILRNMG